MERKVIWEELCNDYIYSFNKKIKEYNFLYHDRISSSIRRYLDEEIHNYILPIFSLYLNILRIEGGLEGKTSKHRYIYFLDKYHNLFFKEFPLLKDFLEIFIESILSSTLESLRNIFIHKNDIYTYFKLYKNNKLVDIKFLKNVDRHNGGKQVLFFKFDNKKIIKYKPSNQQVNIVIEKLFSFLNINSGEKIFCHPKGIYYSDCAFIDYIRFNSSISSNEVDKFCFKAGCYLAFIFLLNGTDFNVENILINRNKIYLIDTETLFSNFSYYRTGFFENRLISTGFVERKKKDKPMFSGLFGGRKKFTSIVDPYIVNDNTDKMRIKFIKKSNFKPVNNPKISGKYYINYKKKKRHIISGFEFMYNTFLHNIDKVVDIVESTYMEHNIVVRQVFRKTSMYSIIVRNLFFPSNWPISRYKSSISKFLDRQNKELGPLIKFELHDLLNLDIPYFTMKLDKKHVYHNKGVLKNFFHQTPLERWMMKVGKISQRHLYLKKRELENIIDTL